jgi:hypothetical protein
MQRRSTERHNPVAHSTHLHLRFAAATAAVIATAGGALLWYVQHQEVQQAERNVTLQAWFVEKSILRAELGPADLARPVTGARLEELDALFKGRILVDGGLRVKIYRAGDGLVTYSDVHSLIGTKIDSLPELREVLGGAIVRDVSYINHEGGTGKNVKALEVYVPCSCAVAPRPRACSRSTTPTRRSRRRSVPSCCRSPSCSSWR